MRVLKDKDKAVGWSNTRKLKLQFTTNIKLHRFDWVLSMRLGR